MEMKHIARIKYLFAVTIMVSFLIQWSWPYHKAHAEPGVSAQAAILIDAESGRILYEKNSEQPLRIASITKIMTAVVALENGKLTDKVTTSNNAYRVEGSSIYLKLGEKLSLEDMLYGLMLRSGNDAAVAIAEHIGGSLEGFIYLMNKKAEELGMTETIFNNPHGLDDHEEHYSSARDMAILTAYAMNNEDFAQIVGAKKWTAPLEGSKWGRDWHNKNRMLSKYPYAEGVKTGYTKRAKRTLVSSANKDGHRLIAVTLNAPDDWNDHISMFEYGFNSYVKTTIAEKNEKLTDKRLVREDGYFRVMNPFHYPLTKEESIQKKVVLHHAFKNGKLTEVPYPAGHLQFYIDNEEIGRVAIEFVNDRPVSDQLEERSFWKSFFGIIKRIVGGI
jgi:D-alanyl-D-alanine carboxypeptidase (penicillin-binding protein 5/6)